MLSYGSFIALINDRALNFPQKEIFHYLEDGITISSKLTYKQLLEQCQRVSYSIKQNKSYQEGEKILLLLPQDLNFIYSFIGSIYAGCVPVTAYPPKNNRNSNRIVSIIEDSNSTVIITLSKIKKDILSGGAYKELLRKKRIICLDEIMENSLLDKNPIYNETMFIQYTSGSTGSPKGVILTHQNVLTNLDMIKRAMNLNENSSFYSWLPFFHDMGLIGCILAPIYVNCPTYLTNPSVFLRDPMSWLKGMSKYKSTITGAPNFAFDYLIKKTQEDDMDIDLSSLTVFFNGAEPVRKNTLLKFIEKFSSYGLNPKALFPCYGMAETTLLTSGSHLDSNFLDQKSSFPIASSGKVVSPMELIIVNPETLKILPNGIEGEILVSGENVSSGYLNEKEKERFLKINNSYFFRTGDLGMLEGFDLFITGRIKDIIIINGLNHYPDDLEKELTDNIEELSVGGCAAIGINSENSEEVVIVAEIDRKYVRSDFKNIIQKINYILTKNFEIQPQQIFLLKPGQILKTSSGKLQRSAIKENIKNGQIEFIFHWTSNTNLKEVREKDLIVDTPIKKENIKMNKDKILLWIEEYFKNRIDLTILHEKRIITPNIILDFASKGLMGMIVPKEYAGPGLSLKEIFKIVEKISYQDISLSLFVGLNNILGIYPIINFAHESIKKKSLPQMAKGLALGAFAITEKTAGSNPRNIEATAKKQGNEWILNGEKIWVGSAAWSRYINAYFKDYDENGHYCGITGFLLDTEDMSISFGKEDLTMGVRPMIQSSVLFENTKITEEALLLTRGGGLNASYKTMNVARLGIGSIAIGALSRCIDIVNKYAQERLINTGIHVENGYTFSEIHKIERRWSILKSYIDYILENESDLNNVSELFAIISKIIGPEFLWTSVDRAMQILGGRGYMEDNILASMMRDARLLRIFEGPTETLEYHLGAMILSVSKDAMAMRDNIKLPRRELKELITNLNANFKIDRSDVKKDHLSKVYQGRLLSYEVLKEIVISTNNYKDIEFLESEIEKIKKDFSYSLSLFDTDSIEGSRIFHNENIKIEPILKNQFSKQDKIAAIEKKKLNRNQSNSDKSEILKKIFLDVSGGRVQIKENNENILNYGLDSIIAIEASMKIEELFGVSFPEQILWDINTIEKILLYIDENSLAKINL